MPRNAADRITLAEIGAALTAHGLRLRGGFHPDADDGLPAPADGSDAGTLLLVGHAGADMWRQFSASRFLAGDGAGSAPLDDWSRKVIGEVATTFSALPLYPFEGPPYWPFQRWAQRAEPVHPSPLGPLIHPEFGLWHAYRGALLLPGRLPLPPVAASPSPCESCAERPCLNRCPVDAVAEGAYDVPACTGHVGGPHGGDCRERGCLARRACPVGQAYAYGPAQAAFHMAAFLRNAAGLAGQGRG